MNVLKFRARDGERYVYSDVPGDIYKKADYLSTFFKLHGFEKIEQFIGLLDKNGKEIYEGDIVENKTIKNVFALDNISGEYGYKDVEYKTKDTVCYDEHWTSFRVTSRAEKGTLEIIGNIHEKKESNNE